MNNSAQTLKLTIDQNSIAQNYQTLVKESAKARCGAAVKANAYGCGIAKIVPVLAKYGCADYFVADCLEGKNLRALTAKISSYFQTNQARIYVLNGLFEHTVNRIIKDKLIPVLNSLYQVELWQKTGSNLPYALHVDTGMNRLGLEMKEAFNIIDQLNNKPQLIISHFAKADAPNEVKNREQLTAFLTIIEKYPDIKASMANSAAVLSNQNALFDLTRPGIAIYGGNPFIDRQNPMISAVKAEAQIIAIRHVYPGETVSYGGTFIVKRPMRLAICGVGYADGYPRGSSGQGVPLRTIQANGAQAFIDGQKINCVGRVTMDLTLFDITDIPQTHAKIGDWVELFGPHIPLDELAHKAGTVNYEILTSIGHRYA